jgi:hypothetical protein
MITTASGLNPCHFHHPVLFLISRKPLMPPGQKTIFELTRPENDPDPKGAVKKVSST